MSTRSGKRLHNSFHENLRKSDLENTGKNEKKTKGRRLKVTEETATVFKISKKRNNYVSYPTDDEHATDRDEVDGKESIMTRTLRKNTLKERNTIHISSETVETEDCIKPTRSTRRTRKHPEVEPQETEDTSKTEASKLKKTKKKKSDSHEEDVSKKTKKKKGKKRSTSIVVEDNGPIEQNHMNKSDTSIDSFHSAVNSPKTLATEDTVTICNDKVDTLETGAAKNKPIIVSRQTRSGKQPSNIPQLEKVTRKRKSSGITNDKLNYIDAEDIVKDHKRRKTSIDTTHDLADDKVFNSHLTSDVNTVRKSLKDQEIYERESKLNKALEKDVELNNSKTSNKRSTRKSKINETFEKIHSMSQIDAANKSIQVNTTFEKDNEEKIVKDTTFDKDPDSFDNRQSIKSSTFNMDTTFEKDSDKRKSIKGSTFDKNNTFEKDPNSTFDKRQSLRNNTFDKNATFEKLSNSTPQMSKSKKDTTFDKNITFEKDANGTFDKNATIEIDSESTFNKRKSIKDSTFDKNSTFEKDPNGTFDKIQSLKNNTFEKDLDGAYNKKKSIKDSTFDKNATIEKDSESTSNKRKSIKDSTFDKNSTFEKDPNGTFDKIQSLKNNTFEKDLDGTYNKKKSIKDSTFDKNSTFEKDTNGTFDKRQFLKNNTFQKDSNSRKSLKDPTFDKNTTLEKDINISFDKRKSLRSNSLDKSTEDITFKKETVINSEIEVIRDSTFDKISTDTVNITFEKDENTKTKDTKLDTTFEKLSKSSLISSDNSNITSDTSRISITSDDSKENIVNTTPVLIESSMDESTVAKTLQSPDSTTMTPKHITPLKREGTFTKEESVISPEMTPKHITPLKREGTFTKEESVISPEMILKTLTKQCSLPSPGCTPFPNKTFINKPLNVTRSLEKRRSLFADALPRATKVMFCSPVNNPAVVIQQKRKVIKSSLKGSNKSFVLEDSCVEVVPGARRKRSYTQGDADDASTKRKRFADDRDGQLSVDRLARPRTTSANGKLQEQTTPSKNSTPSKPRISRTKLPNFAALHQKQFDKMESLDECQERKAKRAKQLLTPTGAVTVLERTSPRDAEQKPLEPEPKPKQTTTKPKDLETKPKDLETKPKVSEKKAKKPETPIKSLPTLKSLNPGYSRFGFRLNLDINPFVSGKTEKKPVLTRQATLPGFSRQLTQPSLTGATSSRREEAKRTVMREKSFTDKRNVNRNENRTIIKGVRTNRRFELQMRMRNIE